LLQQIALIVLPLIVIAMVGFFYGRLRRPDMSVANQLNMDVFLPCLVFGSLAGQDVSLAGHAPLALGAAVVVVGSGLLAWPLARLAGVQVKTFVPPVMFNNAGNLGLPLAVFAFGEPALVAAVVLLVVETGLHFSLGLYILDRRIPVKRIVSMPFIVASVAAIVVDAVDLRLPMHLMRTITTLGEVSIPLMLFALGVRMVGVSLNDWRDGLLWAVINPILGLALAAAMVAVLPLSDMQRDLLVLFGVLPPAVLNYVVAELFRQEPRRVATIVMVGNLSSIVTIPAMLAFIL
jgi:predicted permease